MVVVVCVRALAATCIFVRASLARGHVRSRLLISAWSFPLFHPYFRVCHQVENVRLVDRLSPKRSRAGTLYLTATHSIFVEGCGSVGSRSELWVAITKKKKKKTTEIDMLYHSVFNLTLNPPGSSQLGEHRWETALLLLRRSGMPTGCPLQKLPGSSLHHPSAAGLPQRLLVSATPLPARWTHWLSGSRMMQRMICSNVMQLRVELFYKRLKVAQDISLPLACAGRD